MTAWGKINRLAADTASAIHQVYRDRADRAEPGSDQDWRRDHLGASILGHKCDRFLWLSFRWAKREDIDGQKLRLFERGHREEQWLIDDLRAAGIKVLDRDPETGEQFRVLFGGGHVGGSCDGILPDGCRESSKPHVLEIKTHNAKSFARLKDKGVKSAKPEHYVQMQVYMLGLGIEWAFYLAVNKDNDEMYAERVHFDEKAAMGAVYRGESIVWSKQPPRKLDPCFPPCVYTSKDGTRWPCRFFGLCHGQELTELNCRTCIALAPADDGHMRCGATGLHLAPSAQRRGCMLHVPVDGIVNGGICGDNPITYQFADGTQKAMPDAPCRTLDMEATDG